MMTIDEIKEMALKNAILTDEERAVLAKAIMENPETRAQAITGALIAGRFDLAVKMMFYESVIPKENDENETP